MLLERHGEIEIQKRLSDLIQMYQPPQKDS